MEPAPSQSHHTLSLLHLPERLWLVVLNRAFVDLATAYVLGGSKNGQFNWHETATTPNSTRSIELNLPERTHASTPSHLIAPYLRRYQILRV